MLAIVPLAMQLVLLLWMADLQSKAEIQLGQAERSKRIADHMSSLMANTYFIAKHADDDRDGQNAAANESAERMHVIFSQLKTLVEPKSELAKTVERSEATSLKMYEIFEKIQAADDKAIRRPLWIEMRARVKELLYGDLLNAKKQYEVYAKQGVDSEIILRKRFHDVALFGGAINLLLSGALALFLASNIARRLKRLDDNNIRLASNLPLGPSIAGCDEIARVDQTFRQMAKAMHETARKEHQVIEGARDWICSIDKDGRIVSTNPACIKMLGYKNDELLGARLVNFIHESDAKTEQFVASLGNNIDEQSTDIQMWHKSNRKVDTSWSIQWSESEQTSFCVVHDISERRAAEQLRQEVLHMVSHDLRTPLSTLGNVFRFLSQSDSGLVEKTKTYIQLGERNVVRLIAMVNDLLDIEKIRSGKMLIEHEAVHLDECFQACIEALLPAAEQAGVRLEVEQTALIVSGDADKIDRVIINLTANALKYSKVGDTVRVHAERSEIDSTMPMVTVNVIDQGLGIAEEQLESVFERFHQLKDEKAAEGSGLGLTICKAFVELHGGKIWATRLAQGTQFSFTLPLLAIKPN